MGKTLYDCTWPQDELDRQYHDTEWGVPLHDDLRQFEFPSLEVMQCGLNWHLMLQKRQIFRSCLAEFDFERLAHFSEDDIPRIFETPGMIRSPRKVMAIVNNARQFLAIRREFGTFSKYLWNYSGGKTIIYRSHAKGDCPASNELSDIIARDLKQRGFKFLGSITVYSHLQACGVLNDHPRSGPRYQYIRQNFPCVIK